VHFDRWSQEFCLVVYEMQCQLVLISKEEQWQCRLRDMEDEERLSDVPAWLGLKAVAWAFRICKPGPSRGLSTVNAK
jgi:hypothetical protein